MAQILFSKTGYKHVGKQLLGTPYLESYAINLQTHKVMLRRVMHSTLPDHLMRRVFLAVSKSPKLLPVYNSGKPNQELNIEFDKGFKLLCVKWMNRLPQLLTKQDLLRYSDIYQHLGRVLAAFGTLNPRLRPIYMSDLERISTKVRQALEPNQFTMLKVLVTEFAGENAKEIGASVFHWSDVLIDLLNLYKDKPSCIKIKDSSSSSSDTGWGSYKEIVKQKFSRSDDQVVLRKNNNNVDVFFDNKDESKNAQGILKDNRIKYDQGKLEDKYVLRFPIGANLDNKRHECYIEILKEKFSRNDDQLILREKYNMVDVLFDAESEYEDAQGILTSVDIKYNQGKLGDKFVLRVPIDSDLDNLKESSPSPI